MAPAWCNVSSPSGTTGGGGMQSCDSLLHRVELNDPKLVDLVILPNKHFGSVDVDRLCNALEGAATGVIGHDGALNGHYTVANTHLRSIHASGHGLPIKAYRRLGAALVARTDRTFSFVSVGDSAMGDEGIVAFCDGLRTVTTRNLLESSNVYGVNIEHIDLSYKGMEGKGLWTLLTTVGMCCTGLQVLDVSRNPGIGNTSEMLLPLILDYTRKSERKNSQTILTLKELNLSDCQINGELAEQLLPTLWSETVNILRFSSNPIRARGITGLVQSSSSFFSSVQELYLSACSIDDDAVKALHSHMSTCRGNNLRVLDLSHNSISFQGIIFLCSLLNGEAYVRLNNLMTLNLANNPICNASIQALIHDGLQRRHAAGIQPLHELDLSDICIGSDEATIVALLTSRVKALRLYNCFLGSSGIATLAKSLSIALDNGMECLDVAGNSANKEAIVELLNGLLSKLNTSSCSISTFILGGNEGGSEVEERIGRIKALQPNIDIARDKPGTR